MSKDNVLEFVLRHPLAVIVTSLPSGPPCHAVGGVVRDAVMGNATDDLDLSVADGGARLGEQLAERSGGTLIALGGDRFSSFRVVAGNHQADIWDRGGAPLYSDLERRDLTVNAIACALAGGELSDPFSGLDDIAARTLRAAKMDCFELDPLRVLRLVRFRNTLGFTIEQATAVAARQAASGLARVARERVRDELQRIFADASIHDTFALLGDLAVLEALVEPAADKDALRTLLRQAERFDRYSKGIGVPRPADRYLAALALLAITAGANPPLDIGSLEARGLGTVKELRIATRLLTELPPSGEPGRRLFLFEHGENWTLALALSAATRWSSSEADIIALAGQLSSTALAEPSLVHGLKPLLDGHSVARLLDTAPGPVVGETLTALIRSQAAGSITTPAEAEAFVRKRALELGGGATLEPPSGADSAP